MSPRTPLLRLVPLAIAALLAPTATACTHVKPYERGRLAHPSMSGSRRSGPGESHMQAVHEGATGGVVGGESGCGCN